MTSRGRLGLLAIAVLAAAAVTAALAARGATRTDQAAPAIALSGIGDQQVWRLSDQLGTPVLVNFWASWCTPCRTEMPDIDALVAGSGGALRAVGINVFDQGEAAEAFASEVDVRYPLVSDATGAIARAYDVNAVPYTVVVDGDGLVKARASGRPDAAALEALVADALGPDWRDTGSRSAP